MSLRDLLRGVVIGIGGTSCAVLLLACGAPRTAEGPGGSASTGGAPRVDGDQSGFPPDVLVRPELQSLVDAGLDRRTAPLLEALADADPVVRATAAHALASVPDTAAPRHLARLLTDPDAAVRRNAAFALGQIGDSTHAPVMIRALRNETEPQARLALREAAGKMGSASDLEQILELGSDTTRDDRSGLALALYHFARRGVTDPRGAHTLLTLLQAPDARTRMTAALSLAAPRSRANWGVSSQDLRRLLDAMPADRREAGPLLRVLSELEDGSSLPTVHRWLGDSVHWTVRAAAAGTLADYAPATAASGAIDALLRALDDSSAHVATVAAQTLVALRAGAPRLPRMHAGLEPGVWAEWIREHPERSTVAAALLPGLVGTTHESLVIEWATGTLAPGVARSLAWPALALVGTPESDSLLPTGLLGTRRETYVAAAALAQRLASLPADAALRSSAIPLMSRQLAEWGPHAPGSDVRGVLQLIQELAKASTVQSRELLAEAARHPHAQIRALAVRLGAPAESVPVASRRSVNWSLLESAGPRPCLVFMTTGGSFTVELHPEAAPLAVSALIEWAGAGMYDGLTFHRVEPDFILQSGDFDSAHGYGGPERGLRSEFSQLRFAPGVLGIASFARDTEGSQYFITHNYAPSLDGRYSAVGFIVAGQETADDVTLGDPIVTVSLATPDADTAPHERSLRCTPDHS